MERDLSDGQHRNPTHEPGWFTTAYFHRPQELADELLEGGFHRVTTLAVEGPAWLADDLDQWLDDAGRRATLLRLLAIVETASDLMGASPHLLAVGYKPD